MSDNKESLFDIGIATLRKLINDSSTSDKALKEFAESPESAEAAFNVAQMDRDELTPESKSRLSFFGKLRMAFLKKKFDSGGGGRNMPGKMEYDTIKAVIRDLDNGE